MANNLILDKLEDVKHRFDEVGEMITKPDIVTDMKKYVRLNKEYRQLEPIVDTYNQYMNILSNIQSARQMLTTEKDEEMRELAKAEIDELLG